MMARPAKAKAKRTQVTSMQLGSVRNDHQPPPACHLADIAGRAASCVTITNGWRVHRQRGCCCECRGRVRLEQAERNEAGRCFGTRRRISIRTLAMGGALPARVTRSLRGGHDELDSRTGGLRAAGWPTPETRRG